MKHRILLITFALVVAACTTVTAHTAPQWPRAEGSFDRTLNVSGDINLEISTGSGSIAIRQGSEGRLEIHGRIHASSDWFGFSRDAADVVHQIEANPPIEQNGSTIRVGFDHNNTERNVSISYEVVVPARASVRAHTGSGSQTVAGIEGPVDVNTGSGSITLSNVHGRIAAGTGSGSINATGVRGELRAHTGSGSIRIDGEQTGRWEMQTGSGGIDIRLPRTASFDLNAHTGSGAVTVDFPMTVQGRLDGRRRDVMGKVGSGAYSMDLRTGSGHIRIE
jgi:DUF4097 and DUF4098 domain-containing protein YvlB